MNGQQQAFERAIAAYPTPIRLGISWWFLVEGDILSGMWQHGGKLVLHEERGESRAEFNHWGFWISPDDPRLSRPEAKEAS